MMNSTTTVTFFGVIGTVTLQGKNLTINKFFFFLNKVGFGRETKRKTINEKDINLDQEPKL